MGVGPKGVKTLWDRIVRAAGGSVSVGEYTYLKGAAGHIDEVIAGGEYAGQLARPYMRSQLTIDQVMSAGKAVSDPGGLPEFVQ
jgi:hypothetical protein